MSVASVLMNKVVPASWTWGAFVMITYCTSHMLAHDF